MYDFNIIENPHKDNKTKHSFTIDANGGIYKHKGGSRDYFLTMPECKLVCNAGGVDKIWHFLKYSNYRDTLTVAGLLVVNLNP